MRDMNKQFEYNGYKFNIKVEFNTKVERRIGGLRWHTVTINDMGHGNYYEKKEYEDGNLVAGVQMIESRAKYYVDNRTDTNPLQDQRLLDLGFK